MSQLRRVDEPKSRSRLGSPAGHSFWKGQNLGRTAYSLLSFWGSRPSAIVYRPLLADSSQNSTLVK